MLRICITGISLFVATGAHAQLPDPRHPPSPSQVIQRVAPAVPVAPAAVAPLTPDKVIPQVEETLNPKHVAKEAEKIAKDGIEKGNQLIQGAASNVPGMGGGPVNCPLDKLIEAAGSLEGLARNHADQVRKFNEDMAAAAKNVGEAQANIIKKTVEEAGKVLLNPFDPLIKFAREYIRYIDDIRNKLKDAGTKIIAIIGVVLGFMIGLPFWVFIRAITPRRKPA